MSRPRPLDPSRRPRGVALSGVVGGALALGFVGFQLAGADHEPQDPLSAPFFGITTDGEIVPELFPIRSTGVSTAPIRLAAESFLDGLSPEQRERTTFPVDDLEWRMWSNTSGYQRQGVGFEEMSEEQRGLAFGLFREALSARGFQQTRDIMRLNGYLAEILDNFERYGEFLYWVTVMGEPSETEPWGWQLDGHHLVINYFVLGDQVVMTPTFMGSEPVIAESGPYAGTEVMQEEQALGLALMRSLDPEQQAVARVAGSKTGNNAVAQAFQDNLVLDYEGIRATELDARQRDGLRDLIGIYVGNMADGHARVRMEEVEEHLDETWFAWIGETGPDDTFYYRVQSPVILIEFDHQLPVALDGPRVPDRRHIHSVVRTPNGNDYGKDLLRQHYEAHQDDEAHGHVHGEGGHIHDTDGHTHGADGHGHGADGHTHAHGGAGEGPAGEHIDGTGNGGG
jgi:hypothetical protein